MEILWFEISYFRLVNFTLSNLWKTNIQIVQVVALLQTTACLPALCLVPQTILALAECLASQPSQQMIVISEWFDPLTLKTPQDTPKESLLYQMFPVTVVACKPAVWLSHLLYIDVTFAYKRPYRHTPIMAILSLIVSMGDR